MARQKKSIALGKRFTADVVEIGRRLSECRAVLKDNGGWRAWLETELRLSPQTAGRFIQVYERRLTALPIV
jgi:hypothetical protein